MMISQDFDVLTLERIESLPRDSNYSESFVLRPFNSDLKDGSVTFIIKRRYPTVDIWFGGNVEFNLQEYFIDWLNPTLEENTLWTLETGLEPIETYVERMEKMMKEFK